MSSETLKPVGWQLGGMRGFLVLWVGQLVSLLGTVLTKFALAVWVYQQTGSVTQYALITLCGTAPLVLFAPLAGVVADRFDRRLVLLLSDTSSSLVTLAVGLLAIAGQLQVWHIWVATAVAASCKAFQWPTYQSAIPLLVPKNQLGRASGLSDLGQALGRLFAPLVAGLLMETIQLQGIILIDFASFVVAIVTLLVVWIPPLPTAAARPKVSLVAEGLAGWRYVVERPGLLGLMLFMTVSYFMFGIVWVLATPLVLSFADPAVLGIILSVGGGGMAVGSLAMSGWGGPRRRVAGMFGFSVLCALSMVVAGAQPHPWLFGAAVFCFFLARPIIDGSQQVLLQCKVPSALQGRVFALNGMLTNLATPLAALVGGLLADQLFEPLMATDAPLAALLGPWIGLGPGRGIGLMFILMGLLTALSVLIAAAYPRLRRLEQELPDAIDEPPALRPEA